MEKISEAFGHLIGTNLDGPGFTLDTDAIIRGIRLAVEGEAAPMDEAEYSRAIATLQERAFNAKALENLDAAEAFLDENAHHEGIVCLDENKLQYRIDTAGEGLEVEADSSPLVHYTGRYLDGTTFGSSTDGDPIVLPLDQTIEGFAKGIVGMREGEKRTLYVHPELGYGTSGHLAPNSLLVFDVEVIKTRADHTDPS